MYIRQGTADKGQRAEADFQWYPIATNLVAGISGKVKWMKGDIKTS